MDMIRLTDVVVKSFGGSKATLGLLGLMDQP